MINTNHPSVAAIEQVVCILVIKIGMFTGTEILQIIGGISSVLIAFNQISLLFVNGPKGWAAAKKFFTKNKKNGYNKTGAADRSTLN